MQTGAYQRSFTTGDVKEDPQHGEGERWIGYVRSHIPRWDPQDKYSAQVLPEKRGFWPHVRFPSLGVLHREGKLLGNLTFEGQWGLLSGVPEDWGNRDFTPKGQNLRISQTSGSRAKAVI